MKEGKTKVSNLSFPGTVSEDYANLYSLFNLILCKGRGSRVKNKQLLVLQFLFNIK